VIARLYYATQDVAHFRLVVEQAQERFTLCALLTDAQDVFRRRVQANDQQTAVEKNDSRAQPVKDAQWLFIENAAAAGMARRFTPA